MNGAGSRSSLSTLRARSPSTVGQPPWRRRASATLRWWFRSSYDLSKLRAKGLIERIGKSRRYCLTPIGLKLGVLLVKLRLRLLGPLVSLIRQPNTNTAPRRSNSVDAAYREVDTALDHLSAALGLQLAA